MAARKPSSPYHHAAGTTETTGSVAPAPVHTPPRPGPSPEELAEAALRAKRQELADIEAEIERRKRPITEAPKSGDHDRQLGLAVRTLLKQGAGILATAVITAIVTISARPAASPEKVAQVQDDQREGKKDTDGRLELCEARDKAQQLINESTQDWIATLADKQGIDPGRQDDPWAKVRTASLIEVQSVALEAGKPPRFKAARPLPPVPPRP